MSVYSVPQIQQMIIDAASRYGVPSQLVLGIAQHESGFRADAINTANTNGTKDWGVMQLNDLTVQTMGVADPLDPVQNIDAGVRLFASLLYRYSGDVYSALWAYASGPGNVGPTKTPNSIARQFIAYVMNYAQVPDVNLPIPDSGSPSGESGFAVPTWMIGVGVAGLVGVLLSNLLD